MLFHNTKAIVLPQCVISPYVEMTKTTTSICHFDRREKSHNPNTIYAIHNLNPVKAKIAIFNSARYHSYE